MTSAGRLITAGVAVFVVGLVAMFPARVAYDWAAPPGVALSGLEGSVWSGEARDASIAGLYLRDIEWHFRPALLFTGRAGYRLTARPPGGEIEGEVAVSPGGTVTLTDIRGTLPLDSLGTITRVENLAGTANVSVESAVLEDGLPTSARGSLEVRGLLVPIVSRSPIGGYRAEFFTEEQGITASVEDTDGVIDIAGQLLLRPDRSYLFTGLLAPTDRTPARLQNQMQFLGSPNERGQYPVRMEGVL
jgi:general secretion pathway protein N